jgi:hypothetical protein
MPSPNRSRGQIISANWGVLTSDKSPIALSESRRSEQIRAWLVTALHADTGFAACDLERAGGIAQAGLRPGFTLNAFGPRSLRSLSPISPEGGRRQ